MKVRCINEDGWVQVRRKFLFINLPNKPCNGPKFGDVVTVISTYMEDGEEFYCLMEWFPKEEFDGYQASQFEPFADRPEMALSIPKKRKSGSQLKTHRYV